MPTQMIMDLTFLLAYLTSWDEQVGQMKVRRAWRGYDFEALNGLQEHGEVSFSRRSKSLVLTEAGIRRAQRLAAAVSEVLAYRLPVPPAQA